MEHEVENDDDSFIILSSSPPPNVVFDFNRDPATAQSMFNLSLHEMMTRIDLENSMEARVAVIENGPSPSSLMVASTILAEKSPTELETSVGEIIEENKLLKDTLQKNNESLREQFLMIASCQEDMVKTHQLHKDKFIQTKNLVERLRQENKTLKQEMMKLLDGDATHNPDNETSNQYLNNTMDSLNQSVDSFVNSVNSYVQSTDLAARTENSHVTSADLAVKSANSYDKSIDLAVRTANSHVRSTDLPVKSANSHVTSADPALKSAVDKFGLLNVQSTDLAAKSADLNVISGFQSNASSMIEFVTSPDDDVIDKLTAQLALVENQRRQVIMDNDKLTWQKESLERVVDATAKDLELLQVEVHNLKKKESKYLAEISELTKQLQELEVSVLHHQMARQEDMHSIGLPLQQRYEFGLDNIQHDMMRDQLEYAEYAVTVTNMSAHKAEALEKSKLHKQQILEFGSRLKNAQNFVFDTSADNTLIPDCKNFNANARLYESSLKQIADLLISMADGAANILQESSNATVMSDYTTTIKVLEKQQENEINLVAEIHGLTAVIENIFCDYRQLVTTSQEKEKQFQAARRADVEPLTSALLARAKDLEAAKSEIADLRRLVVALREEKDEKDVLRAQVDVYKTDFLCEREAREKLACEKETLAAELRGALKKKQELTDQLEEVRKLNPNIHKAATTRKSKPPTLTSVRLTPPEGSVRTPSAPSTTGNMTYTCPKCLRFSSDQYRMMEDHFDLCLDDF